MIDLAGMSPLNMLQYVRREDAQTEWQHNMDFCPETLNKVRQLALSACELQSERANTQSERWKHTERAVKNAMLGGAEKRTCAMVKSSALADGAWWVAEQSSSPACCARARMPRGAPGVGPGRVS